MKVQALLLGLVTSAGVAMADPNPIGSGIVALNPTAAGALEMVGNSTVRIDTRAVYVNSNSPSAIRTTGSALLDTPAVYVVGGLELTNNSTITGQVTQSALPWSSPLSGVNFPSTANMTPKPAVTLQSGNATLTPGYYANGITIKNNANVIMSPGVYFVGTNFTVTGGNTMGAGVCIIMVNGAMSISGNGNFYLSPPTSGDWTGMVIAQPPSNTTEMKISGTSDLAIHGAIFAPGARIWFTGTSQTNGAGPHAGDLIIADTIKLSGTADIIVGGTDMFAVAPSRPPLYD